MKLEKTPTIFYQKILILYLKQEDIINICLNQGRFFPIYKILKIRVGKKQIGFEVRLHRAAAEAFIINDDPVNKQIADHKNRNRLDYRVENLRWITYSENNKVARPQGINYEEKIYFPDLEKKIL